MIHGNAIECISITKKKQEEKIKLEQKIEIILYEVNIIFIDMSEEIFNNLESKKTMLNDIYKNI